MGSLRINKVIYQGDRYEFESPLFHENLIVIEGDNGTGKTTFCNLIYFGLGGRVKEFAKDSDRRHKEITGDTNNFVELYITVSSKNFQLRRFIDENDITVTPYSVLAEEETGKAIFSTEEFASDTKILPIFRTGNVKNVFSDWMLEQLGISVVELYQGYATFKINFPELFRLIYHDQQPNPEYIYKQIDTKNNYIADSELLRKAIFELLIGKFFSEYYQSIVAAKQAEKEKALAKDLLEEYKVLADQLRGSGGVKNKGFLEAELKQKQEQLEKLHHARNAFKKNRVIDANAEPLIDRTKNQILELELSFSEKREALVALYDEKAKLISVKNSTANEISQINKIIHSHDQLNLFSADTCPYCLSKVNRVAGHCVCGTEIDEKKYERFFYTSQEYKEILKAKTKTLATLDLAIEDCDIEVKEIKADIVKYELEVGSLKNKLRANVKKLDQEIDIESLNDIDDKILDTREEISTLYQRIETEGKLERLSNDYELKRKAHQEAELNMRALETKTMIEINTKVNNFSVIYNRLMTETLSDCRSARISIENYLPVINEGEYKEASSRVSIRLMYYLTLLEMSLTYEDVTFPKFLLIDTPETAGIELANLVHCMEKIEELDKFKSDYQIILTTGLKKYPENFVDHRVMYMPDKQHSLLHEKNISS
ncbi:MAG: hypothetical protein HYS18_07345 [Burkholderiales bacterium]|nr:hypothetical protein [Burkholderiales bacterium]